MFSAEAGFEFLPTIMMSQSPLVCSMKVRAIPSPIPDVPPTKTVTGCDECAKTAFELARIAVSEGKGKLCKARGCANVADVMFVLIWQFFKSTTRTLLEPHTTVFNVNVHHLSAQLRPECDLTFRHSPRTRLASGICEPRGRLLDMFPCHTSYE
jgi:hypothetical protein